MIFSIFIQNPQFRIRFNEEKPKFAPNAGLYRFDETVPMHTYIYTYKRPNAWSVSVVVTYY